MRAYEKEPTRIVGREEVTLLRTLLPLRWKDAVWEYGAAVNSSALLGKDTPPIYYFSVLSFLHPFSSREGGGRRLASRSLSKLRCERFTWLAVCLSDDRLVFHIYTLSSLSLSLPAKTSHPLFLSFVVLSQNSKLRGQMRYSTDMSKGTSARLCEPSSIRPRITQRSPCFSPMLNIRPDTYS